MASRTGPRVEYRPATEGDLEAEARVFNRAEGGVVTRHGLPWTDKPIEAIVPTLRHLLIHDAGRCFVAEADGRVVAFTAALVRDDLWFFASLFVDPAAQGQGIGPALFDLAHAGAPRRQATLTDSIQPVSNTIYARHGLIPTTPLLELGPPPAPVPRAASRLQAAEGSAAELHTIDLAAYGADRSVDHAFWASTATRTVWASGDRVVAYSYVNPTGRIGPLAALDERVAADALAAELGRNPNAWVEVPGTARALVRTGLEAGLRIAAPVGLLLLSSGFEPPRSLAVSGWFLM